MISAIRNTLALVGVVSAAVLLWMWDIGFIQHVLRS